MAASISRRTGTFPDNIRPKAVPLLGVSAYYDHYWNSRWSTSLGYSITQVDNTNLQDAERVPQRRIRLDQSALHAGARTS